MIPMASSGSENVRRNRPNGSGKPISRSNSFLGTIKNLVTAPLNWFGAHDASNKEDAKGKRRRLPDSNSTEDVRQDDGSRPKKMRVTSPEKQVGPGYLDPPTSIFKQSASRNSPLPNSLSLSSNPRYQSSGFSSFGATQQPAHFRHSASPFPHLPESRPMSIGRTMSLDPPYNYGHGRDSSMAILTRDTSLDAPPLRNTMSVGRDVSLPPTRSFQMRPSLTPRPSSSSMALSRRSRERDPSEPPPVASLMSNPVFLRPPPEVHHNRSMSAQPTVTLGSYLDSQRRTQSPVRQHSALLFSQPGASDSAAYAHPPMSIAEKALHELDVYKTPLLPTRLKNSKGVPDIFQPKKARHLILMQDKDDKSARLGVSGKKKSKKNRINGTKPYAGEGGMKKLLARRKMEEGEGKGMNDESTGPGEDDGESKSLRRQAEENISKADVASVSGKESDPPSRSSEVPGSRPQSSLRVGRTKTNRSHFARPSRPANRFSARYADDDGDDQMQDDSEPSKEQLMLEEAAKKVPVFEIKPGFTFAKQEATPPIHHDLSQAKEPPLAALPFSFAKSGTTVNASAPPVQVSAQNPSSQQLVNSEQALPLPLSSSVDNAATLSSALVSAALPTPDTSLTSSEVTKPTVDVADARPSFSFTPDTVKDAENSFWEGGKSTDKVDQPTQGTSSLFTTETRPPTGVQNVNTATLPVLGAANVAKVESVFGSNTTSIPLFGAPATSQAGKTLESSGPASLFGNKSANLSAFSFATPPKSAETSPATAPTFSFGQQKFDSQQEADKSIQTSPPASSITATTGSKLVDPTTTAIPKLGSAFAPIATPIIPSISSITTQPSVTTTSSTPFSFGQARSDADNNPKTPFSFGAAPSTPPAPPEKKPMFTFGLPAASEAAPTVSFGASTGSSTEVPSKSFTFGMTSTTETRSITPPKNDDQDLRMEESPTREVQPNGGNKESRSSLFPFNTAGAPSSASTLFGQTNQSSSTPFTFGASATSAFPPKVDTNVTQNGPMTFNGFGQSASPANTGFSFGAKPAPAETLKPANATPFSFQTTPTATTTPFMFNAPTTTNNPFSQTNASSASSPSSPSTFNQPSPSFTFNPPAGAPSAPFTFGGSQPSSPASAGHANLAPPAAGAFTFGSGQPAPTSPFGAPSSATSAGGALFTMGAPPPSTPHPGRQVKRLPIRRGGKRI